MAAIMLMRHGEAVDEALDSGDHGRWLTFNGRSETRSVASALRPKLSTAPLLWSSPLVRAVQTTEVLAQTIANYEDLTVCQALSTAGSPRDVLRLLQNYDQHAPLILVGHEPNLSTLAVLLLEDSGKWSGFRKSELLSLNWLPGRDAATIVDRLRA